eukprot:m.71972 g.71972  ORF g.71972 m.71972 type:complete len:488 (+) comp14232_c0_seq1:420-1883(+)
MATQHEPTKSFSASSALTVSSMALSRRSLEPITAPQENVAATPSPLRTTAQRRSTSDLASTSSLLTQLLPSSSTKRRERHYNAASAGNDLKPIANVESSLATSTRFMFQLLKPLDSGLQGKLGQPQLTRQGKAWKEHGVPTDTQLEGLPNMLDVWTTLDRGNCRTKAIKPSASIPALVATALLEASEHRLAVTDIYAWFRNSFPYYKTTVGTQWQNSLRHSLSLNGNFFLVEQDRGTSKGGLWGLTPDAAVYLEDRMKKYRSGWAKKGRRRRSTTSAKPAAATSEASTLLAAAAKIRRQPVSRRAGRRSGDFDFDPDNAAKALLTLSGFSKSSESGTYQPSTSNPLRKGGDDQSAADVTMRQSADLLMRAALELDTSVAMDSEQDDVEHVESQERTAETEQPRIITPPDPTTASQDETPGVFTFASDKSSAFPVPPRFSPRSEEAQKSASKQGPRRQLSMQEAQNMDTSAELSATAALLTLATGMST